MSKNLRLRFIVISSILFSISLASPINAQIILNKKITIESKNERLSEVLLKIGKAADFYFSYNGKVLEKDSLVSISADQITVGNLLKQLFSDRLEIEERQNYLIITGATGRMSMVNTDAVTDRSTYSVSGLVVDELTKERLPNVSVYEKHQLVSTLTDEHGYFRLKLKLGNPGFITLTASKVAYRDTSLNMLQNVNISNRYNAGVYTNFDGNNKDVERTALGKALISARQRIQSMNIPDFFARRPIQFSLIPGLSSHGMLSSQVINIFSLNIIGGYTAGVNGFEFGGLFNINKLDAKYVQVAGVFNLTGGKATGLQASGVHNEALDTLRGVQIAGFINRAASDARGLQVASLSNVAKSLHGVQIGIINTVDSSGGISIGLINIIRNGFYRIGLSTNNLTNTNISLKTGTHQFYTTILISSNLSTKNKLYAFGLGIGHDFMLEKNIFISAEGNYQFAYTGGWDDRWAQAKVLLNLPISGCLSVVAGPTYNKYSYTGSVPGYQKRFQVEPGAQRLRNPVDRWLGWEAGLAYTSVFKASAKKHTNADNWFLGLGIHAGIGWDDPIGLFTGAELFMQRELNSAISGTLSTGYSKWSSGAEHADADFNIIPLKAGIRTYTGKRLFFAGEAGLAVGINNAPRYALSIDAQGIRQTTLRSGNSFLYTVSMGYDFDNGFETGVKFEDYTAFSFIKQFALRLAYRIKL